MDVDLTDEQQFFAQTTRKFLAAECPTSAVRALENNPDGFDRAYWKAGCELGWTSMLVPDSGGTILELALAAEEIGRAVAPGPLVPSNLVAYALARGGSDDQQQRWLRGLMNGELVGAWANGHRSVVEAGAQADVFVHNVDGGWRLVAADDPGVAVTPWHSLDLVRRFAEVTIDADAGEPLAFSDDLFPVAVIAQCAETCGAIDRVFEMTLDYMDDRFSFGRPLSSYQALKHRVADDKVHLEACHAITTAAARAFAGGDDNAAELAAVAKAWTATAATEIIQDCVQLHGGIGVTWEHDIHLYLRRATVNRATYGTATEWRAQLADMILGAA